MSEEELIYLIRCGNEWAFETLYASYLLAVKNAYIDVVIDKNIDIESDDIINEIASKFWGVLYNYREDKNNTYRTYISKCIRNQLYTSIRRHYRYINTSQLSLDTLVSINDKKNLSYGDILLSIPITEIPDIKMLVDESKAEYNQYIKSLLTSKEYDIYNYSIHGYSMSEISEILGISLRSVYNGMYRATKKITKRNNQLTISKKYDKLN